jgi:anthranilate/para-aminobenzoate synthase component II
VYPRANPTQLIPLCLGTHAGKPIDSGISLQVVRELGPEFPLFGVCMGHQCIGEAFGGEPRWWFAWSWG